MIMDIYLPDPSPKPMTAIVSFEPFDSVTTFPADADNQLEKKLLAYSFKKRMVVMKLIATLIQQLRPPHPFYFFFEPKDPHEYSLDVFFDSFVTVKNGRCIVDIVKGDGWVFGSSFIKTNAYVIDTTVGIKWFKFGSHQKFSLEDHVIKIKHQERLPAKPLERSTAFKNSEITAAQIEKYAYEKFLEVKRLERTTSIVKSKDTELQI